MLSYNRRFILAALLAVSACGYTPAYAPGGTAANLSGRVVVLAPQDRAAYALVRQLERRLGQPATGADLRLNYTLKTETLPVGITPEQETTRYQLTGSANFALVDATGTTVLDGVVKSFTAYAATGSTVSTLTATRDAEERLMVILADQIVTRIVASGVAK